MTVSGNQIMTSHNTENVAENTRRTLARLRELVAALDRRVPHIEREGEQRIAGDAAKLRKSAQERIAEIEANAAASVATSKAPHLGKRSDETPAAVAPAAGLRSE